MLFAVPHRLTCFQTRALSVSELSSPAHLRLLEYKKKNPSSFQQFISPNTLFRNDNAMRYPSRRRR